MLKESFFVLTVAFVFASSEFPKNLHPRNTAYQPPIIVFTGNSASTQKFHVQLMKILELGGKRILAIGGREELYLLETNNIRSTQATPDEVYRWESSDDARELCIMKGQLEELCYNYLSILEKSGEDEILICGTNAFDPTCRLYNVNFVGSNFTLTQVGADMLGKLRSPFGPNHPSSSIFTDDSLYSATYQSLFGGSPVLSRTMGNAQALRSTTSYNIMNEPNFVKMFDDGERVLIFYNDIEVLDGGETRTIPQVAQVCKNDVGGERILQGFFVSFLKARLNCSYNGFYLNQITDVTDFVLVDNEMTFFATFATPENSIPGSGVCLFKLSSLHSTLSGPFMIDDAVTPSSGSAPPADARHPGRCPQERLTDPEILFIRSHPQMKMLVPGNLLLTNQGKRWNSIHIEKIDNGKNVLIFIGTDDGHLIRAFPPTIDYKKGLIVSDQDVFDEERCSSFDPSKNDRRILQVIVEDNQVLVTFKHCVVIMTLRWCEDYHCKSSCKESVDPYCGWNGSTCMPLSHPVYIPSKSLKNPNDCPEDSTVGVESATKPGKATENESAKPTTAIKSISPAAIGQPCDEFISKNVFLLVVLGITFVIVIALVIGLIYYYCRRKSKRHREASLPMKQLAEQHHLAVLDGEKRDSLSRLIQGVSKMISKTGTPINSPKNKTRSDPSTRKCKQNNYTEPPSLKKNDQDRRKSARMNSVSSGSSRLDSSNLAEATNPLLHSTLQKGDPTNEPTLPRHIAEANTLPYVPKSNSKIETKSGSTVRTSYSSPTSSGTTGRENSSPNSEMIRRQRSERAANETREIMRESDSAIRRLENTFTRMEENGLAVSSPQPQVVQNLLVRQRIDSNDSGKGESPRNSLQNDPGRNSRAPRPASLNVRAASSNHRNRLLSEGSPPNDPNLTAVFLPHRNRERHLSGQHLIHSHPTTPVGHPPRLPHCQNSNAMYQPHHPWHQVEAPHYSSLQRQESCHDRGNMQMSHHESHIPHSASQQINLAHPRHQHLQSLPHNNRQVKLHRQISEPHTRTSIQRLQTKSMPTNQITLNEFHDQAALQHHPPAYTAHAEQNIQKEAAGPKNHYPSLPLRSSTSPFGKNNSFTGAPGFERPSTLHRREKLPHIMRQVSSPASAHPGIFVPTPTVPDTENV